MKKFNKIARTQELGAYLEIPLSEVEFSATTRLLDPNGRVFFWNGGVFRAIYLERVEFINKLFDDGVVDSIVDKNLLIPSERTNYSLEGFGLVLRHEHLGFMAYTHELPVSYLIDAYKVFLRLYIFLYRHGYTLMDGHAGNLAPYKDGNPVFIDLGSIIPIEESYRSGIFESFSCFYYKLCLVRKGVPYSLLRKLKGNLNRYEYLMLHSPWHRILYWFLTKLESAPIFKRIVFQLKRLIYTENAEYFLSFKGIARLFAIRSNKLSGKLYEYPGLDHIASRILTKVSTIKPRSEKSFWANYHNEVFTGSNLSRRDETIIELVKNSSPKGILDIGANAGYISDAVYPYAEYVLSVDYDEDAVDKNYRRLVADNKGKKIFPILKDVVTMNDVERSRYKQDVVIALALTHHLSLTQRYPFEFISKLMSDITAKMLIVEFMPNGLGINEQKPDPLPAYYNLDNFIKCLEMHFTIVENLGIKTEADNSPRYMLVCRK